METKRLFDRDPYQSSFTANVLSQEQTETGWKIALDQTAFYPESGGQPFDTGTINGMPVDAVYEEGVYIYHYMKSPINEKQVTGKLDFSRRLDHMQQHNGQHMLSAALQQLFEIETKAFHLGAAESTIDIDGELSDAQLFEVELLVNQVIQENRHIDTRLFTRDEVDRRYLKKVPAGQEFIRMVHISDFDLSACCGTHPHRTGEIGLLKLLDQERTRGLTRLSFVCGMRALKRLAIEHNELKKVARKLKCSWSDASERLEQQQNEQMLERKKGKAYYQECLTLRAQQDKPEHKQIVGGMEIDLYLRTLKSMDLQEAKDYAKCLITNEKTFVCFILPLEHQSYQLVLACSQDTKVNVTQMIQYLNECFTGKGGGSPVFGQCQLNEVQSEVELIQSINQYLSQV